MKENKLGFAVCAPFFQGNQYLNLQGARIHCLETQNMVTGVAETEIEQNGVWGFTRGPGSWGFLLFLQEVAFPKATGPEIELNGGLGFPGSWFQGGSFCF